jgi:lactoylglutathione lyase
MAAKRFRVLGLQQIALGGLSKPELSALWQGQFGLKKIGDFKSEKENVDEDVLQLGHGAHAIEVDIMQPLDPEKSPKVHIPALNHIGLWIDDLPLAVKQLTEAGLRFAPGGIRKGASGFDITFLHPKASCGVLIELVQAPPEIVLALGGK